MQWCGRACSMDPNEEKKAPSTAGGPDDSKAPPSEGGPDGEEASHNASEPSVPEALPTAGEPSAQMATEALPTAGGPDPPATEADEHPHAAGDADDEAIVRDDDDRPAEAKSYGSGDGAVLVPDAASSIPPPSEETEEKAPAVERKEATVEQVAAKEPMPPPPEPQPPQPASLPTPAQRVPSGKAQDPDDDAERFSPESPVFSPESPSFSPSDVDGEVEQKLPAEGEAKGGPADAPVGAGEPAHFPQPDEARWRYMELNCPIKGKSTGALSRPFRELELDLQRWMIAFCVHTVWEMGDLCPFPYRDWRDTPDPDGCLDRISLFEVMADQCQATWHVVTLIALMDRWVEACVIRNRYGPETDMLGRLNYQRYGYLRDGLYPNLPWRGRGLEAYTAVRIIKAAVDRRITFHTNRRLSTGGQVRLEAEHGPDVLRDIAPRYYEQAETIMRYRFMSTWPMDPYHWSSYTVPISPDERKGEWDPLLDGNLYPVMCESMYHAMVNEAIIRTPTSWGFPMTCYQANPDFPTRQVLPPGPPPGPPPSVAQPSEPSGLRRPEREITEIKEDAGALVPEDRPRGGRARSASQSGGARPRDRSRSRSPRHKSRRSSNRSRRGRSGGRGRSHKGGKGGKGGKGRGYDRFGARDEGYPHRVRPLPGPLPIRIRYEGPVDQSRGYDSLTHAQRAMMPPQTGPEHVARSSSVEGPIDIGRYRVPTEGTGTYEQYHLETESQIVYTRLPRSTLGLPKWNFEQVTIAPTSAYGYPGYLVTPANSCAMGYLDPGLCNDPYCRKYHGIPIGSVVTTHHLSREPARSLGQAATHVMSQPVIGEMMAANTEFQNQVEQHVERLERDNQRRLNYGAENRDRLAAIKARVHSSYERKREREGKSQEPHEEKEEPYAHSPPSSQASEGRSRSRSVRGRSSGDQDRSRSKRRRERSPSPH